MNDRLKVKKLFGHKTKLKNGTNVEVSSYGSDLTAELVTLSYMNEIAVNFGLYDDNMCNLMENAINEHIHNEYIKLEKQNK